PKRKGTTLRVACGSQVIVDASQGTVLAQTLPRAGYCRRLRRKDYLGVFSGQLPGIELQLFERSAFSFRSPHLSPDGRKGVHQERRIRVTRVGHHHVRFEMRVELVVAGAPSGV